MKTSVIYKQRDLVIGEFWGFSFLFFPLGVGGQRGK